MVESSAPLTVEQIDTEEIPEDKDESSSEGTEKFSEDESNSEGAEEILGDVRSIGDNSVTISRIFTESSSGTDEMDTAVLPAEGSEDEELIQVIFSEHIKYEVKTIKNGGADVDVREGSFADIKEGLQLELTGNYDGNDFKADKAVIYYIA